jgi:hypothetical protein
LALVVKAARYGITAVLGLIAAVVFLLGALVVFVGIYATWAYQDDPSSAQNLIFVPFGLILAVPAWGIGFLALRVARTRTLRLERRDGTPARPASLKTTVRAWKPGDRIPLGSGTLQVVRVRDDDGGELPVLVVQEVAAPKATDSAISR